MRIDTADLQYRLRSLTPQQKRLAIAGGILAVLAVAFVLRLALAAPTVPAVSAEQRAQADEIARSLQANEPPPETVAEEYPEPELRRSARPAHNDDR